MDVILQLVNETTLPDGGPVSCRIRGKRGIDIGRAAHLDWTLPDPTRYISSKHCEIRYGDGGYWLHDVSTNGTFLNGASHRMAAPHRLRNGDRFQIGHYIVAVAIEGAEEAYGQDDQGAKPIPVRVTNDQELWADDGNVPPPINPKELRPERQNRPLHSDFLDWSADVPDLRHPPARGPAISPSALPSTKPGPEPVLSDMEWATGPPSHVPPPTPLSPPTPTPRRPGQSSNESGSWPKLSPIVPDAASAATSSRGREPDRAMLSGGASAPSIDFAEQLFKAAGLPQDLLARSDPTGLAQQIGTALRLCIENLMQLLSARQQTKRHARSSSHTVIQPTDNNPLKFCPSADDALRTMFGPGTSGYLDAGRAISQSFEDIKVHQIKTYSAMQHALTAILADLDPKTIDRAANSGPRRLLQTRKSKLWDAYEARWEAKVGRDGADPIEAFLRYFVEYYDRDRG